MILKEEMNFGKVGERSANNKAGSARSGLSDPAVVKNKWLMEAAEAYSAHEFI